MVSELEDARDKLKRTRARLHRVEAELRAALDELDAQRAAADAPDWERLRRQLMAERFGKRDSR